MSAKFILIFVFSGCFGFKDAYKKELQITLPAVTTTKSEQYLCGSLKLSSSEEVNIVGFVPNTTGHTVHHMLLYACAKPGSDQIVWDCHEMYSSDEGANAYEVGPVCTSGKHKILYAWSHNAPQLKLPQGVGFKVGSSTGLNYLILQVHYARITKEPDSSGIKLLTSEKIISKTAGVLFLAAQGVIRAKTTENFDITCDINQNIVLHPFAFRVHTHDRGEMVYGYFVRNNEWTLIGKKSPLFPQVHAMFYPVDAKNMTLRYGDIVNARCHMKNSENRDIYVGPRFSDEMCNFYLMYWAAGNETLLDETCRSRGPPAYYWEMDFKNAPKLSQATVQ